MHTLNIAVLGEKKELMPGLRGFLDKFFQPRDTAYNFMSYTDVPLFLDKCGIIYDIIFLDAEVRGDTGGAIETARRIKDIDADIVIVFVACGGVQINGYQVSALDVISPDTGYEYFESMMERAMDAVKRVEGCKLLVGARDKLKVLDTKDITYVEVFTHNIVYHVDDAAYRSRGSLKNISSVLSGQHFVYANRCYLVNLRHVKGVNGNTVVCGSETLNIGGAYKKGLLAAIAGYYNKQ